MARGKKKESVLTPEEKLAQALVPDWEQPYKVPRNWCWTTLGYAAKFIRGSSPRPIKSYQTESEDGVNWIKIGDTDSGKYINSVKEKITKQGALKSVPVHKGDLLLTNSMSYGKPFILNIDGYIHDGWFALVPSPCIDKEFLYYSCLTSEWYFDKIAVGTAVRNISTDRTVTTPIAIPPLAEQWRIVDRIEYLFSKLDEAKEKAQSVLDSFETRKAAILHKAFTGELTAKWRSEHGAEIGLIDCSPLDKSYDHYEEPHALPETWRWVRFNECCTFVGSGVTPKGGKEVYQSAGVPFIRSQNVLKGALDLSDVAFISADIDSTMKRTRIMGGETLFNITGASIGRACFVPFEQKEGNVNQHVCILRYKDYVKPELPQFWLNSPDVQRFVNDNQIGQTRQALNFKQIRGMCYPLAPRGEQSEIVRILDSIFAKEQQAKEAAEAVLEKIDLLKKSILARAFRGELGTNDPTEESALELLKEAIR